ncbi:MAG: tRNA epoxyqueuosine(34) reductase QueG [Sedimentisphaerales bacterium]|nr:tRNA epoxyqueuosine(34) reductase QueG [Sedimentisphaerales bacterium]
MTLEQEIKDKARELGFDAVGITDAAPIAPADVERLRTWLASGCAGEMHYMQRNFEKRIDPAALLDGAQSVIVVALNYKPHATHPQASLEAATRPRVAASRPQALAMGAVAQYAQYDDYHTFIRPLLHRLADFIRSATDESVRFKACVDSVPLAERALAVRAGLGFIGRNHMLIHPSLGPQIFLGELVTTLCLEPDEPAKVSCAECCRCIEACPTGALRDDGKLDAARCISYLTIEHAGDIPSELAAKIGDRLFGCDECVLACPHAAAAPPRTNRKLPHHGERAHLDLYEILAMTDETFQRTFAGSPLLRPGRRNLQRTARACLNNLTRP